MGLGAFLPLKSTLSNKRSRGVCVNQLILLLFIILKSPSIAYVRRVYASISPVFSWCVNVPTNSETPLLFLFNGR